MTCCQIRFDSKHEGRMQKFMKGTYRFHIHSKQVNKIMVFMLPNFDSLISLVDHDLPSLAFQNSAIWTTPINILIGGSLNFD